MLKRCYILSTLCASWLVTQPTLAQDSNYKCWQDEDGVTNCGNVVPPQYSQQGFQEFNKEGVLSKKVNPAPTEAELAEFKKQEEEAERKKKQDAEDQALLNLFSTEQDIERARTAIVASIDGNVHSIETIVTSLEKNREDMEKNLEESKNNPDVPASQLDTLQKNIEDVKYRLKTNRQTLQEKASEKEKVNKEYDEYLRRYRDIKRRGVKPKSEKAAEKAAEQAQQSATPQAPPPAPPAGSP